MSLRICAEHLYYCMLACFLLLCLFVCFFYFFSYVMLNDPSGVAHQDCYEEFERSGA